MPQPAEYPNRSEENKDGSAAVRQKKIQLGIITLLALAALIIGTVLLCKSCSSDKTLAGTWDYDSITVYRFDHDGKGALELPNSSYVFTYKADGKTLSIDFEDESATDSIYTYTVSQDTLTLVNKNSRVFVMKRIP